MQSISAVTTACREIRTSRKFAKLLEVMYCIAEGGREGRKKEGREGGREEIKKEGREGGREGGRKERKKGGREERKKEGREGGRKERKKGGREEINKEGREGRREGEGIKLRILSPHTACPVDGQLHECRLP